MTPRVSPAGRPIRLVCEPTDHQWVDTSRATPETGTDSRECLLCGQEHSETLY